MYTKETISSLLSIYTGRVHYTKLDGQDREYYLTNHPLQPSKDMHKPTHEDRVVLWCVNTKKWRELRPDGVSHIATEFGA